MSRTIVIASGKGGVGKTTVTANLGINLALEGKRVVLVDGDIGLNNLDVALGIENRVVFDLVDVAEGKARLKQAIVRDNYVETLFVLPSAKAYASERVKTATFVGIIKELQSAYDFVLIDAPAGVENSFHRAVSAAEEAIVVTTPHVSAIKDADKAAGLLSTYGVTSVGLVVNRVRGDLVARGDMLAPAKIAKLMRLPLFGVIPENDNITIYTTLVDNDRAGVVQAYRMLTNTVLGGNREVFDCEKKHKGFWSKFRR